MDTQLAELKNVQEQLTQIIHSVDNVEKQVSFMNEKGAIDPNTIDNSIMTTTQRISLFNNIYLWETVNDPLREYIFCKMTELLIIGRTNRYLYNLGNIINFFEQSGYNMSVWSGTINKCRGIINTLFAASVFDDPNAVNQIQNIINNKLYPQSPNPIN